MSAAKTARPVTGRELEDKVREMGPVWGTGSIDCVPERGCASFTRTASTRGLTGSVYLSRLVCFDPDTGEPSDEDGPLDFIELEGIEGETYWNLSELPALLRALGELVGAAGITAAQPLGASHD